MPGPFDGYLIRCADGWQVEAGGAVIRSGLEDERWARVLLAEHTPEGRERWLVHADGSTEPITAS